MSASVAIIGAGPSGCFLAQALLKAKPELKVDLIDLSLNLPIGSALERELPRIGGCTQPRDYLAALKAGRRPLHTAVKEEHGKNSVLVTQMLLRAGATNRSMVSALGIEEQRVDVTLDFEEGDVTGKGLGDGYAVFAEKGENAYDFGPDLADVVAEEKLR